MAPGDLKRKSVYNLYIEGVNMSVQCAFNLNSKSVKIYTSQGKPTNCNGGSYSNKESPQWLGITIAEKVLADIFDNVKVMKRGNKGYDFICNGGYKIDVKVQ